MKEQLPGSGKAIFMLELGAYCGRFKKNKSLHIEKSYRCPTVTFFKNKKQYMHGILRALQVPAVPEKETSEMQ